jgi:OOP family OmpA-OmpF porin
MPNFIGKVPLLLATLGLLLAGCATSSLDDLSNTQPGGSPFNQALFRDYKALARSFDTVIAANNSDRSFLNFDFFGNADPDQLLAEAFADKALQAAENNNVEPEPASDSTTMDVRSRLVRLIAATRDKFPTHAARAQASYDCWVLNATVSSQAAASHACQRSLRASLAQLQQYLHPLPPVAHMAQSTQAPTSDFTIYFDFDSWTLTAQDLAVLTQAVDTARAGGQSRITIVGHTDTAGNADYNQRLSIHRAHVAMEAMVDMGARRDAISVSGVGENDLAVQTGDGIREEKNRRDVITLLP